MDKESREEYIVRFWGVDKWGVATELGEIEVSSREGESFEEALERYKRGQDNDARPIPEDWDAVKVYKMVEARMN